MKFFTWLFRRKPKKIKLGLALGSGGAKGFAELGAVKAFEENGITFDMFSGTSIGSIVGAFLAQDYSSVDIYEMLKRININEIKSSLMLNMDMDGIYNIIDRNIGGKNIEELNKPFFAVSTEMDSGKEFVFKSGNVAKALCASASYPPFFKAVNIDGKKYIDGAFTNSIPADLLKENGADYVVGIDLSDHQPKNGGLLSMLFPSYSGGVDEPWEKGYKYSDFMLHPDLSGFKAVSFNYANEMYEIGYQCAILNIQKIKNELDNIRFKRNGKK